MKHSITKAICLPAIILTVLIFVCVVGLMALARGPEGFAVAKEVPEKVSAAMERAHLKLASAAVVSAGQVSLPLRAALKHAGKRLAGLIGVALVQADQATDYSMQSQDGHSTLHLLVRVSGDDVIGIVIRCKAADIAIARDLGEALMREFPTYRAIIEN